MTSIKNQGVIYTSRRRQLLLWAPSALALASASAAPSWAAQPKKSASTPTSPVVKPEKRTIILATTNPSALPYLPLMVAQQMGFFAQQGIELQISEQQSAARAVAAVASGSADVLCGWMENVMSAPARALSMQSFVLLGKAPMMALGISARLGGVNAEPNSKSSGLAQLRGRKIGVVALNSPTHTIALAALRRAGLRADDVGFVSVGSPASAQAALRSGQIDALMHMDPLMLQLEQRGEVHVLADLRSPLAAYNVLGMHLPSSCLAAPEEFLQRLPGTAQACSDALVQALRWLAQASLRDMLRLQQSFPPSSADSGPAIDAQSFLASYEQLRLAYSPEGECAPRLAIDLLHVMSEAEPTLRLEKINALRSVNNTLSQRSLARLKSQNSGQI